VAFVAKVQRKPGRDCEPWVNFGDGKSEFDTQLTPGKPKLAQQLGDDLHNTMPGPCTMITVNVKP
jgi:hypothetical protein